MNKKSKFIYLAVFLLTMLNSCRPAPLSATSSTAEKSTLVPSTMVTTATDESVWLQPTTTVAQFEKADQVRVFSFPTDHGAHSSYQTEWWYFTGSLLSEDGSRFGYELTFFRRGLTPTPNVRSSDWAAVNIYMAHFAITDVNHNQFFADQRFSREGDQLAGAIVNPYGHIWLEDWSAIQVNPDTWELNAVNEQMNLSLHMTDRKGVVLHGDQGLSRKSAENASYYYSLPRLDSNGTIQLKGKAYSVQGEAWMDHEFSTSALAPDQMGWD